MPPGDIALVACALKDGYPGLLTVPGRRDTGACTEQVERAVERLDAARERLQGGHGVDAGQLTLDLAVG